MSGWTFTRERPAPGGGFYWTDGRVAENHLAGLRIGTERRNDFTSLSGLYGACEGFVYFIAIGDPYITHVKIGFTNDSPFSRLKSLQTGCPFPMRVLGFILGNKAHEAELHRVLADDRTTGEWFAFSDRVEAIVRDQLEAEVFA